LLKKAIAQATGATAKHIDLEYKKVGDLGLVAMVGGAPIIYNYQRLTLIFTTSCSC